LQGGLWRIFLR